MIQIGHFWGTQCLLIHNVLLFIENIHAEQKGKKGSTAKLHNLKYPRRSKKIFSGFHEVYSVNVMYHCVGGTLLYCQVWPNFLSFWCLRFVSLTLIWPVYFILVLCQPWAETLLNAVNSVTFVSGMCVQFWWVEAIMNFSSFILILLWNLQCLIGLVCLCVVTLLGQFHHIILYIDATCSWPCYRVLIVCEWLHILFYRELST